MKCHPIRRFLLSKMVLRSILLFVFLYLNSLGFWFRLPTLNTFILIVVLLFFVQLRSTFAAIMLLLELLFCDLNIMCSRVWNSGAIEFVVWTLLSASSIFLFLFDVMLLLLFCFYLWVRWHFRFVEMHRPHLFIGEILFRLNAPQHKTFIYVSVS